MIEIRRVVEKQEADAMLAKGDEITEDLVKLINDLKANPGKHVEVAIANFAKVRNKINYLKKNNLMPDMAHLNFKKAGAEGDKTIFLVEWLANVPEPVVSKSKTTKKTDKKAHENKVLTDQEIQEQIKQNEAMIAENMKKIQGMGGQQQGQ